MNKEVQQILNWFNNYKIAPDDYTSQYAYKVVNKQIVTSNMVYLQCLRHVIFLYRQQEVNFPFRFYKKPLLNLINFTKDIVIPETKKAFIFPDFRQFMAGFILGWRYKDDPESMITEQVFDVEARKQWKSSFWAMFALAVANGITNDSATQTYIIGPQREASRIVYDTAQKYIQSTKKMRARFHKYNTIQIISKKKGLIKALAFEKKALEGKNPSLVILTEYHLHKDDTIQESAMLANNLSRKNFLIIYDTTKGNNIDSVCYEREHSYKTFLKRQIDNPFVEDPTFSVFLWAAELDKEDYNNWEDESLWIKANPALGISVSLDKLRQEYSLITSIASENEFKIKRLGM
ncbi:Phage terminase-like protein, large subunit [Mesomycoplasma conjunctivae]|nr:Phage terminase-like protein, large subunit [Mesomycoplasma conjunctivae]